MASIYKRGKYYWASFYIHNAALDCRERMRTSTNETDPKKAQVVADTLENASKIAERMRNQKITRDQFSSIVETIFLAAGVEIEGSTTYPKISDYYNQWKNRIEKAVKPATYRTYKANYSNFETWLKKKNPHATLDWLTTTKVKTFYNEIADKKSVPTANNSLKTLRLMYSEIVEEYSDLENPTLKIKKRKVDAEETLGRLPFTMKEVRTLLAYLDKEDPEWSIAVKIGLLTGCRLADAVSMNSNQIKGGIFTYKAGKTGKVLHIPIVVEEWKEQLAVITGSLTPTLAGYTSSYCSKLFLEHVTAAKIDIAYKEFKNGRISARKSFHSLRHTVRTAIIASGGTDDQANMILGHSKGMGERYTHADEEAMRQAMTKALDQSSQS